MTTPPGSPVVEPVGYYSDLGERCVGETLAAAVGTRADQAQEHGLVRAGPHQVQIHVRMGRLHTGDLLTECPIGSYNAHDVAKGS